MKTLILAILIIVVVSGCSLKDTELEQRVFLLESEVGELQIRNQSLSNAVLNLQSKAIEQDAKVKALARIVHAGRKK